MRRLSRAVLIVALALSGTGVAATPMQTISRADLEGLSADPAAMMEGMALFAQGLQIWRNVRSREAAHAADLARRGVAEVPASRAAVRYRIDMGGYGNLLMDDWGEIYVDRRFVTNAELATIKRIEAFVWKRVIEPLQRAKVVTVPGRPKPSVVRRVARAKAGVAGLPIFRGFEDARYQSHDALIARLVAAFNADKAGFCGGTSAQAAKIADLTPAMVKSHLIEEAGGNDARSKAAWAVDPLQVNVPGDWGDEKILVGLAKPAKRNEGTAERNVRAAIMYLSRKGFTSAARPAADRPKGYFDGWRKAYERYNGRRDRTASNRHYSQEYADKILRRAQNPDLFVPIEIKVAKKK